MTRHAWKRDRCSRCRLERRKCQSMSQRKRDHGALVYYFEYRRPGGRWEKVSRGHTTPKCQELRP